MSERPTTSHLHAEHWRYVRRLLPRYGITGLADVEDVAQEVWLTVDRRRHTYDEGTHQSWRAWLTGIARRCAANHRRAKRSRPEVATGQELVLESAGPDREMRLMLWILVQKIPSDDQREALLLQVVEGLSVAEIAAVQGVTPAAVEKRLRMAKKRLRDDDERFRGAFLGFGSMEALAEALRPKEPIPDEVGEREWERIAEAIRRLDGAPAQDGETPSGAPPPDLPVPPPAGPAMPVLFALSTPKLAAILAIVFTGGAVAAATWGERIHHASPAAATAEPLPILPSSPKATSGPLTGSDIPAPSSLATSSAPGPATRAVTPIVPSRPSVGALASRLLLAQADRALEQRRWALALSLVEQHARSFGALDLRHREALRREASSRQEAEAHPFGSSPRP